MVMLKKMPEGDKESRETKMGNFAGHALPGSFFIGFGIWWTFSQFHRYFTCQRRNIEFTSTCTYPVRCGKWHLPLAESIIKIVLVLIGLTGELYTGYDAKEKKFTLMANAQHSTMFLMFGMSGVSDILLHFKATIPKDMDYAISLLALGVEGLLFHYHLHGRSELDVRLHTLLIYAIVLNIIGVILEMKYRHSLLATLSRTYFFFVQGTWFWQIGFILYSPLSNPLPWKPGDHVELMLVTMYFTWHCALVCLIMLVIGCFVGCFHKNYYKYCDSNHFSFEGLVKTDNFTYKNVKEIVSMEDSEESEL